jgi:GT2 family glycosyltransferase
VVDGVSNDGTLAILKEQFQHNPRVQIITNSKKTTPYALNLGIKYSKAEYVMILGAHSLLSKNYVKRCVQHLSEDVAIKCAGGLLKSISENPTTAVIAKAMSSSFGVGNSHFRTGAKSGYVDTVAFGMYPKALFDEIGFFDEDLARNQDDEMSYRILKHGYKIYLDTEISATYYVRSSLQKLASQQFQYGYWKVYVNKKHKAVTTLRQMVPLFFLFYLFSIPLGYFSWVWLLPLILYTCIALIISLTKAEKLSEAPLLFVTFFILHLSYGYGYLRGIIDFIFLNKTPLPIHSKLTR